MLAVLPLHEHSVHPIIWEEEAEALLVDLELMCDLSPTHPHHLPTSHHPPPSPLQEHSVHPLISEEEAEALLDELEFMRTELEAELRYSEEATSRAEAAEARVAELQVG